MKRKIHQFLYGLLASGLVAVSHIPYAWAQAASEDDLRFFLERVGDFLIRTIGPGVLVIGLAVAGVSMALGDEQGMRRGALAAGGGALIMLSRAVLDFIQNVTRF